MCLLYDNAASFTHNSCVQYNLMLRLGAFQTRTATSSFTWFTRNNRYHSANAERKRAFAPLAIGTMKQTFLENLKSAAYFQFDFCFAMTVYLPV